MTNIIVLEDNNEKRKQIVSFLESKGYIIVAENLKHNEPSLQDIRKEQLIIKKKSYLSNGLDYTKFYKKNKKHNYKNL